MHVLRAAGFLVLLLTLLHLCAATARAFALLLMGAVHAVVALSY